MFWSGRHCDVLSELEVGMMEKSQNLHAGDQSTSAQYVTRQHIQGNVFWTSIWTYSILQLSLSYLLAEKCKRAEIRGNSHNFIIPKRNYKIQIFIAVASNNWRRAINFFYERGRLNSIRTSPPPLKWHDHICPIFFIFHNSALLLLYS